MALSALIEAAKNEFARAQGMPAGEARTLEAFFAQCVLRHRNMTASQARQSWHSEKMLIGGTDDAQLDSIAIFLNGAPLRPGDDLTQLEQMASDDASIDLSFIFVQATGAELGSGRLTQKMAAFGSGVFSYLDSSAEDVRGLNPAIREWVALKEQIFAILDENDIQSCCECAMYFVSPRNIRPDDNIARTIQAARNAVAMHRILASKFHSVEFFEMGLEKIEGIIRDAREERSSITVSTSTLVPLPAIAGVDACYIGYLEAKQLLALISQPFGDGDLQLKSSMFASNIRSFLGLGSRVNASIAGTIADSRQRGQFVLRSNGIAIVAQSQRRLADGNVVLNGAQIVNGCQTSHALFHCRQHLDLPGAAPIYVPVKVIVTSQKAIEDAAILGLNCQTPVDETQLFSQKDLVDQLAETFRTAPGATPGGVLFEARTDEFKHKGTGDAGRIVTLYDLLYAGSSAFYRTPEHTARQRREQIIEDLRAGAILSTERDVYPLYLCGHMIIAARQAVEAKHAKKWPRYAMKNMLLYAMRLLAERHAEAQPPQDMHAPEAERYFSQLGKVFLDPKLAGRAAARAADIIISACATTKLKMTADNARKSQLADEVRRLSAKTKLTRLFN